MGVVYGFSSPWAEPSADAPAGQADTKTVNVESACLFLRAQAAWLRRGLERSADPAAVGIVLGSHDASHESWLSLIAAVHTADHGAANAIASLYGFHGRIVGSLERGFDGRLDADLCVQLRTMLGRRLTELTEDAIARLSALDLSSAPRRTGHVDA